MAEPLYLQSIPGVTWWIQMLYVYTGRLLREVLDYRLVRLRISTCPKYGNRSFRYEFKQWDCTTISNTWSSIPLLINGSYIQLFQKTSEEKPVFKPRPQGNVGCFKSVVCWQTITSLNWSLIFVRHLYWTILIILVLKKHKVKLHFSRSALLLIPIFEYNFVQLISKETWH